jgi:hypothetical protein
LDPFKTVINENNILDLTEGNTAVIPCELPNGNPRPIPLFTLDNNRLDIESKSSMRKEKFIKRDNKIVFFRSI